jgi:hypothetical protein
MVILGDQEAASGRIDKVEVVPRSGRILFPEREAAAARFALGRQAEQSQPLDATGQTVAAF